MNIADQIHQRLTAEFSPNTLEILDESEQHRGHAGFQEGGQSHYRVRISAPVFADMTRLARHRAVHNAIGDDIIARIHALALEIAA